MTELMESGSPGPTPSKGSSMVSQSIQRALDVIETLSTKAPRFGMTLTELAAELELPKSTVTRILGNLEMRGFVEEDALRRFRVGIRLFTIGGQALANSNLRSTARPFLEDLSARVGESAYLGMIDMDHVLYIDRIESPQPVKSLSPIGSHRPLNATAMGKVLLSQMPRQEALNLLSAAPLSSRTPRTVSNIDELMTQLEEIARTGVAVDVGEWDDGLTCIAAPLRGADRSVVGSLGVSGPSWRMNESRWNDVSRILLQCADEVSCQLGYSPNS